MIAKSSGIFFIYQKNNFSIYSKMENVNKGNKKGGKDSEQAYRYK